MDMELNSKKLKRSVACAIVLSLSIVLAACNDDDSSSPINPSVADDSSDSSEVGSGNESSSGSTSSSSSSANFDSEYSGVATLPYSSSTENVFKGTMTDERDGQTYKTIKIGTQTWMAENLNYAYTSVPYDYKGYTSDSTSWCYNDSAEYCAKYGRFYSWSAAMDSAAIFSDNGKGCSHGSNCVPTYPVRGVCPEGWHLPSEDEWRALIAAVGGDTMSGIKLKSTTGWDITNRPGKANDGNGWDAFGFNALPVGNSYQGTFNGMGREASFWSSTINGRFFDVFHAQLSHLVTSTKIYQSTGELMHSVRCLKDEGDIMTNVFKGTMTDERDGQTYKTIRIGTQTWMAENLNYAYTSVPYNYNEYTSDSTSWCYNDSAEYCAKYGRLYTWAAAMDSAVLFSNNGKGCGFEAECKPTYPVRGICPSGWHVPTYDEFETLFEAVGSRSIAGLVLKSFEGWHENGNGTYNFDFKAWSASYGNYEGRSGNEGDINGNGTYDFDFKALPAGYRNYEGRFGNEGDIAFFWSSTPLNYRKDSRGDYMYLAWDEEEALYWRGDKKVEWTAIRYNVYGFSVRCIKDED